MATPQMGPPPDVSAAVPDVSRSPKERILGGIGGVLSAGTGQDPASSPLQKEMDRQHGIRLAGARRHYENATTYGGILGTGEIDPSTGEPTGTDPNTGKPLTPEQRTQYKAMMEGAWSDYEKAAGVSKEAKGALQQHRGLLDLLVTKGHKALQTILAAHQQATQAAGGGQGDAQVPAAGGSPSGGAPSAGATAPAAASSPPAGLPPPPASPAYNPQTAAQAPALRQGVEDNRQLALEQRKSDILTASKVKEEQARAEATASIKANKGKHLQHVPITDPNTGETTPGSYDPETGEYLDQHGDVVKNAQLAGKPFHYVGKNGEPLIGFMVGTKLQDAEGKPLPAGTQVFSAWMQPMTTTTDTVRSEPQPDGTIKLVPVETTSTRTRGGVTPPSEPSKSSSAPASAPSKPSAKATPSTSGRVVGGRAPASVAKSFTDYNAAQERYNVMQKALPDALKGDQQAMLNLLANHIGMTMGLQKGSRITQAIYGEALQSAPWLSRVAAHFDDRGYLSGVVLTPEQMTQMIRLAKSRLDEDHDAWQREVTGAKSGFGMTGTPSMTPPPSAGGKPKTSAEYLNSIGVH